LDVIAEAFKRTPVQKYIEFYERTLLAGNKAAAARRAAKAKPAGPKAAKKKPARGKG
jgi:hypothetical protein